MFEGISEVEKDKVKNLINHLLGLNFLLKNSDRDKYYVARRYKEQLLEYFRFIDWDFVLDEQHEVVFVISPEWQHRRPLSKEESIWILIIRLIYQEQMQELSLTEFPVITLYEIQIKYQAFNLAFPGVTKLDKLLHFSSKYQLTESLDTDLKAEEYRIKLYHSLIYAINIDQLEKLNQRIQNYASNKEGDSIEVDDTVEVN